VAIPPIVINGTADAARSLLESAEYGLVVEVVEQRDPVLAAGTVITTNPPPNTLVDRGSTVVLIVSSGPGQERVPPLIGLTEGQARNQLSDKGFGVTVTYRELPPGDARDGTVLEQSIPTGQEVDKGTTIDLVVGQSRVAETTTTTSTTTTTTTTSAPPQSTAPPASAEP
jgi:beta-lactam-binding protein with PASTA domain